MTLGMPGLTANGRRLALLAGLLVATFGGTAALIPACLARVPALLPLLLGAMVVQGGAMVLLLLRQNRRMHQMAYHDGLTGLPNRLLFRARLEAAADRLGGKGEAFSVLLVDLDGFKGVNDALGHGAGDSLLVAVAERLRACLPPLAVPARLGGDEFAVLLPHRPAAPAPADIAAAVVAAMDRPFDIGGERVSIGASAGVAEAPRDATDGSALLRCADLALYRAKSEGRSTVRVFEPGMAAQFAARQALAEELSHAVERREFDLRYQPIVELTSGRVAGFEALLRWAHPVRGMISPVLFLPLAEESGLIHALGDWAIRRACAEAVRWPPEVKLAVNLSARQVRSGGLVRVVADALARTGLAPERLELDIPEAALLAADASVLGTLQDLRAIGVRLALDDFGTGYSSLASLQRFPIDVLKLDGRFVAGIALRPNPALIVQSLVGLAQRMGMATTVEGLETEEQLNLARSAGCREAQGYLFDHPLLADEAERRVRADREPAIRTAAM